MKLLLFFAGSRLVKKEYDKELKNIHLREESTEMEEIGNHGILLERPFQKTKKFFQKDFETPNKKDS